ncbi:DUF433 domain-containing protein [[Phormidium] sp. ETS-05]|uniref:DUF433 domain-containing protein n=1 Tax=[Phormidium] sp. ETS-05 TaxID=222819 RepID=UPI001E403A4B|nr:DUF433 domain-containing protein [[Phormidium] sp. ETS-05]
MTVVTANITLKDLQPQLLSLSSSEKLQAIQILAASLEKEGFAPSAEPEGDRHRLAKTWPGIEKTPGVCGGDACIGNTRIPVWLLVSFRRSGCSDAQLLEGYPTLGVADLENAWAYAETHADEIEKAIRENEED